MIAPCVRFGLRSLSGHALHGSNILRLVYIDEAGISAHEPILVVAAVIVHADKQLLQVERYLDRLVATYIPPEEQDTFVFHAHELFNGGGKVFNRSDPRFPLTVRLEIANKLAEIPRRFGLWVTFGHFDRAAFAASDAVSQLALMNEKEKIAAPHVAAFMTAAIHVEHWMRKNAPDEVCILVAEDNREARRFIKETHTRYQNKKIVEAADPWFGEHFPFRKIREEPLFQGKRRSNVLQIADFCAYVIKRHLTKDTHYDAVFEAIRERLIFSTDERRPERRARK